VDGALTSLQARVIAHGARECGNGLLDLSTRGNLQIRGVRENTHDILLELLVSAGLAAPEQDRPKLTICSPLAGLDPTDHLDARDVARRIEDVAGGIHGLPPKTAVVIDGGGALALDPGEADVALLAIERVGGSTWVLALPSPEGPVWIGTTGSNSAPGAVAGILDAYAKLLQDGRSEHRRVRDLPAASWLALLASVPLAPAPAGLPSRAAGVRVGWAELDRDRLALLAAAAVRADRCSASRCCGRVVGEFRGRRAAPLTLARLRDCWRGAAQRPDAGAARRRRGLHRRPDRSAACVAACPGLPACASATTPTRGDAMRLVEAARPLIAAGGTLHVSGCAKAARRPSPRA
jgi:precorrin-3B synthase